MICRGCVKQHAFLAHYTGLAVTNVEKEGERRASRDETPGIDSDDQEANPDVETPDSGIGDFSNMSGYIYWIVNLHHVTICVSSRPG